MSIDNKPNAGRIKLFFFLVPLAFTAFIAVTIFLETFDGYNFLFIVAIIFILVIMFLHNMKFRYIIFDIKDNKIVLRYHGLGPMGTDFKAIEFPAEKLAKYEIKNAFFGIRKELVLYQETKKGIAKYPGVSLSAMAKKDREKLLAVLYNVLKLKG